MIYEKIYMSCIYDNSLDQGMFFIIIAAKGMNKNFSNNQITV